MKSPSIPLLLAGVGGCVALGLGIGWISQSTEVEQEKNPALMGQSPQSFESLSPKMNQFAILWSKTGSGQRQSTSAENPTNLQDLLARAIAAAGKNQSDLEAMQKLSVMALTDPAAMRTLLRDYDAERSQSAKDILKLILVGIRRPEVLAFSSKLATSSDPAQRMDGLEMLRRAPVDSAEVRNIVKQALATEQNPALLVQALTALKVTAVEPAESNAIVAQLRTLSQNPDPTVRSQSIIQLSQWDKSSDGQDRMAQALTDQSQEVRQAALWSITQSGVHSDSIKTALMNIITNANESNEVKGSATVVLERLQLSKEELALLNQARSSFLDERKPSDKS